jgi:hypothetical protein
MPFRSGTVRGRLRLDADRPPLQGPSCLIHLNLFLDCCHAEPQAVVPELRRAPEAERCPAVPGAIVPATAPEHPVRDLGRIVRILPR